jgi:6-pyruvoyltetrahydropterin/6-carboxytetrahydropterin synthase
VSFTIAKRFSFEASHALTAVPEDHKCRRLHGHNYEVEVQCRADELDHRGMVVDYFDLDPVRRFIDATVDHRHLNDVIDGEPTAERLAWWLYEALRKELPAAVADRLEAVRVHETPRTWAEYRPPSS